MTGITPGAARKCAEWGISEAAVIEKGLMLDLSRRLSESDRVTYTAWFNDGGMSPMNLVLAYGADDFNNEIDRSADQRDGQEFPSQFQDVIWAYVVLPDGLRELRGANVTAMLPSEY